MELQHHWGYLGIRKKVCFWTCLPTFTSCQFKARLLRIYLGWYLHYTSFQLTAICYTSVYTEHCIHSCFIDDVSTLKIVLALVSVFGSKCLNFTQRIHRHSFYRKEMNVGSIRDLMNYCIRGVLLLWFNSFFPYDPEHATMLMGCTQNDNVDFLFTCSNRQICLEKV